MPCYALVSIFIIALTFFLAEFTFILFFSRSICCLLPPSFYNFIHSFPRWLTREFFVRNGQLCVWKKVRIFIKNDFVLIILRVLTFEFSFWFGLVVSPVFSFSFFGIACGFCIVKVMEPFTFQLFCLVPSRCWL